jgi:hypothetical protein
MTQDVVARAVPYRYAEEEVSIIISAVRMIR